MLFSYFALHCSAEYEDNLQSSLLCLSNQQSATGHCVVVRHWFKNSRMSRQNELSLHPSNYDFDVGDGSVGG